MSEEPLSPYKYQSFRDDLEEIYGCPYLGQGCPPPYADPDDAPDLFQGPQWPFSVPKPTGTDGFYYQWEIIRILEANKLQVLPMCTLTSAAQKVESLRKTGSD